MVILTSKKCVLTSFVFFTFSALNYLGSVFTEILGFPGGTRGKEPACQCRRPKRHGFDPWSGRSPGGGQPAPVFLPGESH